jgi:tRNA pseudouridine38-40 synthase
MRAFRIAYDGRPFHGFQRQPDVPTVEDALFDALSDLDVLAAGADRPTGYTAAGRTDAGVSALAQTVAFEAPDWLTPAAFNGELPAAIRAWASAEAPDGFHATHDAAGRSYRYHLHAPERAFATERAATALSQLVGEHDFHNLTPDDEGTVRDLDASLARDGEFVVLDVAAGGFARQLVRRLVTLVAEVGRGERAVAAVDRVLAADPLPGPRGVGPAPPEPLVLRAVDYPALDFDRDSEAAASAEAVFEERRVAAAARARVSADVRDGVE